MSGGDDSKKPIFGLTILGSGSRGNATVIHCPGGKILLDAGFSAKELCARMEKRGIGPEEIRAILITHEHNDHVQGCRVFADKFKLPVYLTPDTAQAMKARREIAHEIVLISAGCRFDLCGATVEPFSVSHDVADAVAYTFRVQEMKLGYATDLGCTNMLVINKLCGCSVLVLESNYDPERLRNSVRPLQTKRRIMSRHGHLSNADAMAALGSVLTERTRRLVFAHLSAECNRPDLVWNLAEDSLKELHRTDINVSVASQEEPLETIWIQN